MKKTLVPLLRELVILSIIFVVGVAAATRVPVPSSLLSLTLFLLLLLLKVLKLEHFNHVTPLLLSHLALFFIPPTVMILDSYTLFARDAWKIVALLVVSNVIVMGVTGAVVQYFLREEESADEPQ